MITALIIKTILDSKLIVDKGIGLILFYLSILLGISLDLSIINFIWGL